MYRCSRCRRVVPAHEPSHEVVAEVRSRTYRQPPAAVPTKGRFRGQSAPPKAPTQGWEAARTQVVCGSCLPDAKAHLGERLSDLGLGLGA